MSFSDSAGEQGETIEAVVGADAPATRFDKALAGILGDSPAGADLSRSRLQQLIRAGQARVDGITVTDPGARVGAGARLGLVVPPPEPAGPAPEAIPLAVIHEDDALIVIDKPAGLVVHPAPGSPSGTLVNALLAHCGDSLSGIGGVRRPGIVHRLDKDTSGVMVVAKTDRAHQALAAQFADHGRTGPLQRAYLALCWGAPLPRAGTIDAPLERMAHNREKIAVTAQGRGREAITHYRVEEDFYPQEAGKPARKAPVREPLVQAPLASLVHCELETGRTHQIRVHLAHRGHPLLGDSLYGSGFRSKEARLGDDARDALAALGRQALHAALLGFAHPETGEEMVFESPLPPAMQRLIEALRGSS
ncbi:MAG: RluA family pseudouridine synthase [Pseudochelatococcus sp.]|uniref:RluA family pseudouridine synthase n=1 Tax=Pseudochelatococcus sp. TaxID=2020869 RepID=UPI003D901074